MTARSCQSQRERLGEAASLLEEYKERRVRTIIRQLKELFTCPLCFDNYGMSVKVEPTTLRTYLVRHLHSQMMILPDYIALAAADNVPHPDFSFPFTPNKAADNANRGMVWKEADSGNVKVKWSR